MNFVTEKKSEIVRWQIVRTSERKLYKCSWLVHHCFFFFLLCIHTVGSSLQLWGTPTGILKYLCFSQAFSFKEVLAAKVKCIFRFQIFLPVPLICHYSYPLYNYGNHIQSLIFCTSNSVAYIDLFFDHISTSIQT